MTFVNSIEPTGCFSLSKSKQTTDQEAQTLRRRALGNILVRDHLVSGDGRATAIAVELDPEGNSFNTLRMTT